MFKTLELIRERSDLSHSDGVGFTVAHQRFMVSCGVQHVVPLPAGATIVAKTAQITTEEWTSLNVTDVTKGVLEVWVDLNL